ncbi:MAG: DUF503 domain-containing protein [Anaerolineaceae bacterium]|nr:DUF503 domain-containing protein [Anaerolineaceae bacterium]
MIISGCLILKLYLPECHSLKQKRSILKSILLKTRNQYNVASAELDFQDVWQSALLGFSTIGSDAVIIRNALHAVEAYIESNWPDVQILDTQIDLL